MFQKSIKNQSKMDQKWTKHRSKLRSGGSENEAWRVPNRRLDGLLSSWAQFGQSWGHLESFWKRLGLSWELLGSILGGEDAIFGASWGQVGGI